MTHLTAEEARGKVRGTTTAMIHYRNHKGETAWRRVVPQFVWFGATKWHHNPQWLLHAQDIDKDAPRDFAMVDILRWGGERKQDEEAPLAAAEARELTQKAKDDNPALKELLEAIQNAAKSGKDSLSFPNDGDRVTANDIQLLNDLGYSVVRFRICGGPDGTISWIEVSWHNEQEKGG